MRDNPILLNLLCCPTCRDKVKLYDTENLSSDGHIIKGTLKCSNCDTVYPIQGGVPRFAPTKNVAADISATVKGFGYEWKYVNKLIRDTYFITEKSFLDLIHPIQPEYFREKIVLDAGCGAGRFTYHAQQFGAKAIVGVDLSEAVDVAFQHTRHLQNVIIIQADISTFLPLQECFDYVFSVGVLHHTPNPRGTFEAIVRLLKPEGGVSAWVYGRENNDWVINFLNPIRLKLTSRLPRGILLALSYFLAVPLWLVTKSIYGPIGKIDSLAWLKKHLPYFDYLFYLSGVEYRTQTFIVFDVLVPTITKYTTYQDFQRWFSENKFKDLIITSRNGNSWRGFGVRSPLEDNL